MSERIIKTKFEDFKKPNCEKRDYKVGHTFAGHGQSYTKIECPFCFSVLNYYIWSFSSLGKRCECGALLSRLGYAGKLNPELPL